MKRALLVLLFLNLVFFGYVRLVDEPGRAPLPTEAPAPIPRLALVGELAGAAGPRCLSVGPFADRAVAAQASTWLRRANHALRERSLEADGPPSYWVALTTKTLQQAARISMRLKAAGINDLEIMPPGPGQTDATVSLGIYSERDRAERRVTDLRRYAVNPAIVEQAHKVTQWWLDVAVRQGDPPFDAGGVSKAVPAAGSLSVVPCPTQGAAAPHDGASAPPAAPSAAPPPSAPVPGPAKPQAAPA